MAPTALLSVSDKQDLIPLAEGLLRHGYRLISSGGTAAALASSGLPVTKVAEHTGGRTVTDPLAIDRDIDATERQDVESFLATHVPGAVGRLTAHAACLYTMSPDSHFLLGLHPDEPRVAIAAGFSGHGFKFASVVGEVLADLALDGATRHPVAFLSPSRFGAA